MNDLESLLAKFGSLRGDVRQLKSERFVSHFGIISWEDVDADDLGGLTLLKHESTLSFFVINTWSSSVLRLVKLHGFIINSQSSI